MILYNHLLHHLLLHILQQLQFLHQLHQLLLNSLLCPNQLDYLLNKL